MYFWKAVLGFAPEFHQRSIQIGDSERDRKTSEGQRWTSEIDASGEPVSHLTNHGNQPFTCQAGRRNSGGFAKRCHVESRCSRIFKVVTTGQRHGLEEFREHWSRHGLDFLDMCPMIAHTLEKPHEWSVSLSFSMAHQEMWAVYQRLQQISSWLKMTVGSTDRRSTRLRHQPLAIGQVIRPPPAFNEGAMTSKARLQRHLRSYRPAF